MALVASCGASPTAEPAPQAVEVEEEAQPVEEAEAQTEAPAKETEAEQAQDGEAIAKTVQESGLARELNLGITVETDEPDVSSPRSNQGGEYRDVATSDAVSFHPYQVSDGASFGYQGQVFSGSLLRLDENTLEYIPHMAESYNIADDGLTFTFHLRQDLQWSDGQPLTAYDFKWAYDQAIKPENAYPYLSQLEFISTYEALDDYTIQVTIEEVYAPALGQMAGLVTPLPKHIWEDLDWSDPEKNPEILKPTVVSGPYILADWKRDQFAIFEANENYWYHGAPNIERQVIEIVPDSDIAYQKLKAGETDTAPVTPENLEEARQLDNVNIFEWWSIGASTSFIGLNVRQGFPTHDINVRHGLNYAIDKEELTDEVMLGQAKRVCSIYPETSWAYNPDVPCYDYNLDQAIEAFEAAGYTYDGEQMLDENGEALTLRLLYGPNTNKVRELIAVTVQDYLSDIGITVDVQAMEWSSFLEAFRSPEPEWDMVILSISSTTEPHTKFPWWLEENIPEMNFSAYINKDIERLFEEAGATYDIEVRKEKYGEIQRIIAEDSPHIYLYYGKSWSAQSERIKGIEPTVLGIGWNSLDWYIEE
jgi:peptide/nickel transport system substrate-binding protein